LDSWLGSLCRPVLLLQILVNNLDEFFGGQRLRGLAAGARINQMFADRVC